MPRKTKAAALAWAALPPIPHELIDHFVTGPMTAEAVNDILMAFKRALIERALGAELSHHLGYLPGAAKPAEATNHRNGSSAKTVLTDTAALRIEALLDSTALRRFVGIDLGRERVPDGTTLLKFRRLLEKYKLGEKLFATVGQVLQARGLKVGTGTIVDATIIGAPSSTKNALGARDPEMHQTRKGQQWYFGMKMHIGVDSRTGLAHSAVVTAANVHDKHPLPDLLHGGERRVYGDSAYASQKPLIGAKAPHARDFTNQRTRTCGEIDEAQRSKSRNKSKVQARVEHVFAVVKRLCGFNKVRYRGLAKNATRSFVALDLANIYQARGQLA